MLIEKNVNLKKYNTFQVDSTAKFFCNIKNEECILELLKTKEYQKNKNFVLWSWANIVFVWDFDGLVIKVDILGKKIIQEDDKEVLVGVWAGENRNDFVIWCAENNFVWIENMAYIPSSVWACAVQNIWAYGVEAKDIIENVEWVNLEKKEIQILKKNECNFGYRQSIFKSKLKDKFIITKVVFKLKKWGKDYKFNCEYNGIKEKIDEMWLGFNNMRPIDFANVITEIRKEKLPDWKVVWTAGSFFKNPVISINQRGSLKNNLPELKWFEVKNGIKLSAWQLIDICGFKWKSDGKVWTYKSHALVLVNEWAANGKDVQNFAKKIQNKVKEIFGVELEPEAIFVE